MVVNGRYISPVLAQASSPTGRKSPVNHSTHYIFNITTEEKWKLVIFPLKPCTLLSFPWACCVYITFKMKILFM